MTHYADGPRTAEEWFTAFEVVTALTTARVHGIPLTFADATAGYDVGHVASVACDFASRVVSSLDPDDAAEVCRRWGMTVASRGAVTPSGSEWSGA